MDIIHRCPIQQCWTVWRTLLDRSESDLHSCEATLAVAKKAQKKFWSFNRIWIHDLQTHDFIHNSYIWFISCTSTVDKVRQCWKMLSASLSNTHPVIVNKLHRKKVGWPPTDHLLTTYGSPTDHLPTTYRPPSDHLPTTYWPLTDHLPTTYWPPTDHLPTTYRPPTDHLTKPRKLLNPELSNETQRCDHFN